jgi:hypothetical protein
MTIATQAHGMGATVGRWADRMASAVRDWVINALAERLALAVITALA